jgi:hypothetical protein
MFQTNFWGKLELMSMLITFSENRALCEIMWRGGRGGRARNGTFRHTTDQNKIRQLHNACWLPKATNTHLGYIIIIAFSRQQWLSERALILHYTFIACLAALTTFCLDTKVLISQHFTEYIGFLRTYQLDPRLVLIQN